MKKIYILALLVAAFIAPQAFGQITTPCDPHFGIQVTSPGNIQVTPVINTTTNEIHHVWNFGDGSNNDFTTAPSHNYAAGGVYMVKHILYRSSTAGALTCIDSLSQAVTIAFPCNLSAQFTSQAAATNSLGIQFTNTSLNFNTGDSIRWNFGDGQISTSTNPYHVYANAGTYNVCLWVKKNNVLTSAPCVSEICHTVTVSAPCNLVVNFTSQATPNGPNVISFTNTSTGYASADTVTWSFGDGSSNSNLPNPTHTYAAAGTYHVCLIIKKAVLPGTAPCINYICHDIVVTLPVPCNIQPTYTVSATSIPYQYHFQNTTAGFNAGDSIRWDFGDNTYSYDVNPNHTYAAAGSYTVCIWVKKNTAASAVPCTAQHCGTVVIFAPCNIHASFTYQADPNNPGHYYFTNTSTGMAVGDSTIWTFDGNSHAYTSNTDHYFTTNGNHTVCLLVKRSPNTATFNNGCADDSCVTISVTLPNPCNLQVGFSAQPAAGQPNHFIFTNNSTGYSPGDSAIWSFGDNTYAYTYNADHTYSAPGNYTVCLTIKKMLTGSTVPCIRQYCMTISVTFPTTCNLTSGFTFYRDSLALSPYTYHFTNTSTGFNAGDSIFWTFGNGASSNAVNPIYTYPQPGTYNVCLRVQKRVNGVLTNCISEICHQVVVPQVCNLQPTFTHTAAATNPLLIYFNNTTPASSTSASATWYFGDGTSAAGWNQSHQYAQAGSYYVCLRVQYGNCVAYKCDSVRVFPLQVPCTQLANFHTLTPSAAGNSITVTPNNIYNDVQYTWTFGDGTGSHDITASHTYATAGTYTVCLTAYRNNTCAATSCITMQVPNCNFAAVDFTDHRDSLIPNKITFTAMSNYVITDQIWTITKLPATSNTLTIHQNNPTYVFPDTGYYQVCLKATLAGGCVKTICRTIHITQVVSPTASGCSVQVYPNPATTEINAVLTLTQPLLINAYIYNSLNVLVGQKQQQGVAGVNTVSMNIATLPAGVYIIRLVYGNQVCYVTFVK